jgi:RNA methyltransferase, TrmH family
MPVRIVQSKHNARLKELRRALSSAGRTGAARIGVEGPNLVAEAVRAGLAIDCVFVAQEAERLLDGLALPTATEILLLPRAVLEPSLTTETPQPVAALVEPRSWTWEHLLTGRRNAAPLVVVLAGVQDPGNLGTILRSAEAFGATGVVSLPGTVSLWNPKAVRASAGSVFRMPALSASAQKCFLRLQESEVTVWATATRHAKEAHLVDLAAPVAFLIGNEGDGLDAELAARAHGSLTIPCPGPVESLNAAVAASVLLYEASRQRTAVPGFLRVAGSGR